MGINLDEVIAGLHMPSELTVAAMTSIFSTDEVPSTRVATPTMAVTALFPWSVCPFDMS